MISNNRKPNLKAPRFRLRRYSIVNTELHKQFLIENPNIHIDYLDFKFIIEQINLEIIQQVLDNREGVLLPKGLGRIWIGLFLPKDNKKARSAIKQNPFDKTEGKICWNFDYVKYKIKEGDFYGFMAHRNFKRTTSKALVNNPELYARIASITRRTENYKKIKLEEIEHNGLNNQGGDKSSEDTEQSS